MVDVKGKQVTLTATRGECRGTSHWVDFEWNDDSITFADLLEVVGELPIPPYLNRDTQESDKETYQTVYSKIKRVGSRPHRRTALHRTRIASIGCPRYRPRRTDLARRCRHLQAREK